MKKPGGAGGPAKKGTPRVPAGTGTGRVGRGGPPVAAGPPGGRAKLPAGTGGGVVGAAGPPAHRKPARARKPAPVQKRQQAAKKRRWSPGSDVACCAAEAVGTLLGWDWDRVLELYWRTASDPDSGASILDTLTAARPRVGSAAMPWLIEGLDGLPLILGVELPGPHAIAVTPDGTWWSWGEPFDPDDWPDMAVEEAWALWPP